MLRNFFICICLLTVVFAAEYRLPKAQRYTVTVSPNLNIIGSYYPATVSNNSQLVVLFHMLGRNRGDWNDCSRFLQKEGYAVVSVDLPGHGESTNGRTVLWATFTNEDFQQSLVQCESIMQDVRQKLGIPAKQISLVGMGYGASVAGYLHSKGYSAATVLIEPIALIRGIELTQYIQANDKPLYVIVNNGDGLAQKIKSLAANCTLDVYSWYLNPLRWFFGNTLQYEHIVRWLRIHVQG